MKNLLFFCFLFLNFHLSFSQNTENEKALDLDTSYIQTYYNDLIIRIYSANKNNHIQFNDVANKVRLKYTTNDYFNLGFGFNYKWFGLNIGTKIPYFSSDDDRFGKTTSLGMQSYLYARRFSLDVLALKTQGYYLSMADNSDLVSKNTETFYQRSDISSTNVGLNINYVLNYRRFSYKAAFKQNALQKKSAGSILFGAGIYLLKVDADSAFVPREIDENYYEGWQNLDAFQNVSAKLNIGYAYSWIPAKKWIVTASSRVSLGIEQNSWHLLNQPDNQQLKLTRSAMIRVSAGHHFNDFYLGATFVGYQHNSTMQMHALKVLNGTNYTEFTVSKRIKL